MKNLTLPARKILFLCLALALAFLDQLFKYLVVQNISVMNLPLVTVIPGVLSLTYVDNPGMAWSMLMDHPEVLLIGTAVLLAVLLAFFWTRLVRSTFLMTGLSLVLGGGLGNLADRLFRGSVVDYLRVEFIDFPVFNFADCLVVVGVALVLVWLICFGSREEKKAAHEPQHRKPAEEEPILRPEFQRPLVEKRPEEDLEDDD